MKTIEFVPNRSAQTPMRHALALAEEARRVERLGRHAEADRLAAEARRRICHAQSALRTVGEFAGWGLRGVANGVAAVGGAVGRGVYDLGTGVAGGWTGQYAPVGPATSIKQPNGPNTAHLPSPEAEAWTRSKGTTLDAMITRCRAWVAKNGSGGLIPHLSANGVPDEVITYVNRRST